MGKLIKFRGKNYMITIFDVANYFVMKSNSDTESTITPLKLQKLCYYAQAWSMVWDGKELFKEDFQAWVHGPANYELFKKYQGFFRNEVITYVDYRFDPNIFSEEQLETLDIVWNEYGKYTGSYLEQLTHQEEPWKKTRGTASPGEACSKIIPKEMIKEYYSKINA